MILFYAQFIMKRKEKMNTFRNVITMILLMLPVFMELQFMDVAVP